MTSGEIVLVTGANTGLGLAIVKALVQSGKSYTILLGGRDINKAEAATKQLQTEFPETAIYAVQIDIAEDDSIQKLHDQISSRFGRVDVLINNAGLTLHPLLTNTPLSTYQQEHNSNRHFNPVKSPLSAKCGINPGT